MALAQIVGGGTSERSDDMRVRALIAGAGLAVLGTLLVIFPVGLLAQNAGQDSGQNLESSDQNTIRGTVVNAVTHLPIARALVHSADDRYALMSDSDGHFEFTSAPGAQVFLLARKPGFLGDRNLGSAVQASSGREITIALTPESVIKGRVSISTGDGIGGIQVQLLARHVRDGLARWTPAGLTQTKSDGTFRFADLNSGSYKIMTQESMDNDPVVNVAGGPSYGFPPEFFPAAMDFSDAGTIELAAGQTFEASLTIAEQPYYAVKIPVANGEMNGNMDVRVMPQGQHGPGYSLGYNAGTHKIEGLLPNGDYTVEAFSYGQDSASGQVNLRVAGAAAEGSALTLGRNSSLTLEVKEEFTRTQEVVRCGGEVQRAGCTRGPGAYLDPMLEPVDEFEAFGGGAVRPQNNPNDNSLVMENVLPGRYWLRLSSSRGYVAAATFGGIDLLHEPFEVGTGANIPVEITMRDDTATLDGTVTGGTSQSPQIPQGWVYCVPIDDSPGHYQESVAGLDGKFTFPEIAAGTYRVMAFASAKAEIPYRDPEAMRAYESRGQVVQLAAGQSASVQLQVIPDE